MKHSVLTVGDVCMKTSYGISAPRLHGKVEAGEFRIEPSGSAIICSCLVTRLGGEGVICGKAGGDFCGNKLRQYCEAEEINSRFLFVNNEVSTCFVTEFDKGESCVCYNGAKYTITSDEIEKAMISYPDVAIVDMNMSAEICENAFNFAAKYKVKAIASFSALDYCFDFHYINGCEIIIIDAESARTMTGIEPRTPDMCVKACLNVYTAYSPKYVILRLGERGALSYDGKHCEFYPGIDSSEKFKTISDDAFIASLALDYAKNDNIAHACNAANIVSALTEIRCDSVFKLPTAAEVNEFVKIRELKI